MGRSTAPALAEEAGRMRFPTPRSLPRHAGGSASTAATPAASRISRARDGWFGSTSIRRRQRAAREVRSEARRICDRHVLHLIKSVQASGPGSPASARDQLVLRRSPPIKPSRNNPANAAIRSC